MKIFFMPKAATSAFHYVNQYDMLCGERFYDLTWNHGIAHEQILSEYKNSMCLSSSNGTSVSGCC